MQRDYLFDNIKSLLIFLVILGHAIEPIIAHKYILKTIYITIYSFHMPLFIFISGYLVRYSSKSTVERVKKTLKLYLIAQFLYCLFNIYILNTPEFVFTFTQPAWTLWYLLALSILYLLTDYMKSPLWIPITLILSLLAGYDSNVFGYLSISRVITFLPYFCLGYFFKTEYLEKMKSIKYVLILLSFVIVYLFYKNRVFFDVKLLYNFYPYQLLSKNMNITMLYRLISYLIAAILSSTVLTFMTSKANVFSIFGKYTLFIYLVHPAVIQLIEKFKLYKFSNKLEMGITVLSIILITYLLATLINISCSKLKALCK